MRHVTHWLSRLAQISTTQGDEIEVWRLNHRQDPAVLTAWAKHFREHYCPDAMIDILRDGTPHSRKEFLETLLFPDQRAAPGPSIRSGDFGEILVADYLQFSLGYWVPRARMDMKASRNESVKGCDVLGFKIVRDGRTSPADELAVYETKAMLSTRTDDNRLQTAVNDSAKDHLRRGMALSSLKRRLIEKGDQHWSRVQRFQNPVERPYKEINGAAAVLSTHIFDDTDLTVTETSGHPNRANLRLLVIHGNDLMPFVHALYQRAADEA